MSLDTFLGGQKDVEMLEMLHEYPKSSTADFKDPEFQLHPPWFLLPNAEKIDVPDLFWTLDSTITQNRELWWPGNKCGVCGFRAVLWQRDIGYRCEDHLA